MIKTGTFERILVTAVVFVCVFLFILQVLTNNSSFQEKLRLSYLPIVENESAWVDLRYVRSSCDEATTVTNETHREMQDVCRCSRAQRSLFTSVINGDGQLLMSACSDHATARGLNQKVIVYTFYGSIHSKYFNGTSINVKAVAEKYPGWTIRVYHNLSMDTKEEKDALCHLWCSNDHLDLCDVRHLPEDLCDKHNVFGMLWRFFPLGDPFVERFAIRDIDSVILQREVDSVNAWIKEDKTWHVMRDNPQHGTEILGGMWGGMNRNLDLNLRLRNRFIETGSEWKKGRDQHLLTQILWPVAKHNMTSHDSYLCNYYEGTKAWPTQRIGRGEFVGDAFPWENDVRRMEECPVECRPVDHKDWIYC